MEWVIVAAVAGAALICPTVMFGPVLLHKLGLRKGSPAAMSCLGMQSKDSARGRELEVLHRRRAELDDEIAMTQILADGAAQRRSHPEDR